MSTTTRDALAEALRAAWSPDWANRPNEVIFDALADALLASGALTDATKLAEDEALIELRGWRFFGIRFRVRSPRAESE